VDCACLLPYLPSESCKLDDGSLELLLRPFFTNTVLCIFTFLAVVALLFSYGYTYLSRHRSSINLLHKVGVLAFWRSGRAERRPVAKPWSWDAAHTTRENGSQKWAPPTWWCHRAWASLGGKLRSHGSIPKTKTRSAVLSFVCSRLTSKQPRFIEGVKPRPARCKAAAGVQRVRGAERGKCTARARGGAEPRHPHSGSVPIGDWPLYHLHTTPAGNTPCHWQCAHETSYWLSTLVSFCSFLLSSFPPPFPLLPVVPAPCPLSTE